MPEVKVYPTEEEFIEANGGGEYAHGGHELMKQVNVTIDVLNEIIAELEQARDGGPVEVARLLDRESQFRTDFIGDRPGDKTLTIPIGELLKSHKYYWETVPKSSDPEPGDRNLARLIDEVRADSK